MRRREFIGALAGVGTIAVLPRAFWSDVFAASPATPGAGPYGPLLAPDANGIQLPAGFTSRRLATTGDVVSGTSYTWHGAPDGGGVVATGDGGWVYVSNSELGDGQGGCGAIRFGADGSVVDAYPILTGTDRNCAGGMTPWGTWLSCEEAGANGQVYECDPRQPGQGVVRPALGSFNHEAAAVDPATGDVYLTEDSDDGRLYKFVPSTPGDLSAGNLFAAAVTEPGGTAPAAVAGAVGGVLTWVPTSASAPDRASGTTAFRGGEGIHLGSGVITFTTKGDNRIWEFDLATSALSLVYDCDEHPNGTLTDPDNIVVHAPTGRTFVAEDAGDMELVVIADDGGGNRTLGAFCQFTDQAGSEVTGPAFSPDGSRLYVSSQRGVSLVGGITYEITGPFDRTEPPPPVPEPVVVAVDRATYVRGGTYAAANFDGSRLLQVCFNGNDQYTRRTFLSAPLTDASGPYELAVLRVRARVWTGGPSPIAVLAVPGAWDPSVMTWNDQPAPLPAPTWHADLYADARWFDFDVTEHVNALHAADAATAAFTIRQGERNGPLAYVDGPGFGFGPELRLTPGSPPATTTVPTTTTTTTTTVPPTTTTTVPPTTTTTVPPPTTTTVPPTTTTTIPPTTTTTIPPTTTTTVPGATQVIAVVRDTWVRGGSEAGVNHASSRLLHVCNNTLEQYTRWAYLGLDVASSSTPIVSAMLRLSARMSSGGPSSMSLTPTSPTWVDTTLTWTNRPAPTASPIAVFDILDTDSRWYEVDVTAAADAVRAAGGGRLDLIVRQEQRNGPLAYFEPSNHWSSRRPELVVTT